MKKKNIKNKPDIFIFSIKIILLFFLFMRPFFDGFSSPTFNMISNLFFFGLAAICLIAMRDRLDFTSAQIIFFLFVLLCLFLIPFWPLWYKTLKEFTYLFSLFSVWILFKTVFKEDDFPLISKVLCISLTLTMVYGIHQYFWGLESTRKMLLQNPGMMRNISETYLDRMASNRIFATFVYPNTFAGYMLMIYPIVFFSIFSERQKNFFKITNIIILSLLLPVFAATESMGGWFCFIVISFLMLLFFLIPKKFFLPSCVAILFIALLLTIAGLKAGFLPKLSSLTDRISYWIAAVEIFKNYPIIGVGPGNFSHFYLQFKLQGTMEAKFAHNLFFEILVSTGLIGCCLFFLSVFFFIKKNIKKILLTENYVLNGLFFGIFGIFLHCLVDFDYADAAITTIVFAFAGLIETAYLPGKTKKIQLTKLIAGIIIILIPFASVIEFKTWRVGRIIESIRTGNIRENPVQVLEKAASIYPEPDIFFMQGEIFRYIYNETRNIDFANRSINAYKKAIEINGFVPAYHRTLARILIEIGKYDEAEKHLLEIVKIYPTKALYNLELGLFYRKMGKNDLAKVYIEKGVKLPPSSKDEARMLEEYKNGKDF
ncbi:MAG: O-antigen ligase family protein [bacterium]|nr:O-antigen ligase family protein [bacterium]